jgi:hypothetical protein
LLGMTTLARPNALLIVSLLTLIPPPTSLLRVLPKRGCP